MKRLKQPLVALKVRRLQGQPFKRYLQFIKSQVEMRSQARRRGFAVWATAVLGLAALEVSGQALRRFAWGVTAKNVYVSPMISYQVHERSHFEFTLPINAKWAPDGDLNNPGISSHYGALKLVRTLSVRGGSFDVYPMFLGFRQENVWGAASPFSWGLGVGKTWNVRGWSVRPELELSSKKLWYGASGLVVYYYAGWPSVGLTVKR
jgi:hypothetical protein